MGRGRDGGGGTFANVPCIDETFTNEAPAEEFLVATHPVVNRGLMTG